MRVCTVTVFDCIFSLFNFASCNLAMKYFCFVSHFWLDWLERVSGSFSDFVIHELVC